MSNGKVINIKESAKVNELTEEVTFLRGQNQALFAMLSYVTEFNSNGNLTIPADFGELITGSDFQFDRDPDTGDYVLKVTREEAKEQSQPTE